MNSCIDLIMFSRRPDISSAEDIENSMSRRRWKRERSHSTHHLSPNEDEELANCLVLLSNSGNTGNENDGHYNKHGHGKSKAVKKTKTGSVFQCKACKKVFASHQALGGHRASHKKVKGCFATEDKEEEEEEEEYKEEDDEDAEDEDEEEDELEDKSTVQITRKRSNAHECTICHRIFSSGQALGGHKRCHWLTPSNYIRMSTSLHDTDHHHHHHHHNHHHSSSKFEPSDHRPSLDLNLACQEYSVDRTALIGRSGNDNINSTTHTQSSSSWLKLASGDWS